MQLSFSTEKPQDTENDSSCIESGLHGQITSTLGTHKKGVLNFVECFQYALKNSQIFGVAHLEVLGQKWSALRYDSVKWQFTEKFINVLINSNRKIYSITHGKDL